MTQVLALIERLREALQEAPSYTEEALAAKVRTPAASLEFRQALRVLDDRMEILVDAATRTVRGRRRLTAHVLESLTGGPRTQAELRAATGAWTAAIADVVGWLVKEGRVDISADAGGVERVRLKRGQSGAQPTTA